MTSLSPCSGLTNMHIMLQRLRKERALSADNHAMDREFLLSAADHEVRILCRAVVAVECISSVLCYVHNLLTLQWNAESSSGQ